MLDAIDEIDWTRLSHAYGEAADVPDLLRSLASDCKEVWNEAIHKLYGNIWHQGTVYQASAFAAPFLIELLNGPTVRCKPQILSLLQAISTGDSYINAHHSLLQSSENRDAMEFQEQLSSELEWVQAAHKAVVKGVPSFLQLLNDPDAEIRSYASYALATCIEERTKIDSELTRRLADEKESKVKSNHLLALSQIAIATSTVGASFALSLDRRNLLIGLLRDPMEFAAVRLIAGLSLLRHSQVDLTQECLLVFRDGYSAARSTLAGSPWLQGDSLLSEIGSVLSFDPALRLRWTMDLLNHSDASVRKDAVWEVFAICRTHRFAPQIVAPTLAKLVADDDPEVRMFVADYVPRLGNARNLATPILEGLLDFTDANVRYPLDESSSSTAWQSLLAGVDLRVSILARKALKEIRRIRAHCRIENYLRNGQPHLEISELVAILERGLDSHNEFDSTTAIMSLEFRGPTAISAVSILHKALRHHDQWICVPAARALWKISRNSIDALPVLLAHLEFKPTGILAMDCLGEMGRLAEAAILVLRGFVDSDIRVSSVCLDNSLIEEDEAYCALAHRTIQRIESITNS